MNAAFQEPLAYTVAQAAELLQCSRDTIEKMCRRGELNVIRLGRAIRIPRPELERLCGIEPSQHGAKPGMMH